MKVKVMSILVIVALFKVRNLNGNIKNVINQVKLSIFPSNCSFTDSTITNSFYYGDFKDERDGKTYKWVRVGDQIWMAQNLAYKADRGCSPFRWKKKMAEKEGYLYDWETAQKVPPKGWHLPSIDEYKQLINYVGGTNPKNTFIFLVEKDIVKLNFKNNGEYWADFPKKGKGVYNGGTFHPVKRTKLWTSTYHLSFHKDTLYSNFGIRYTSKEAWLSYSGDKLDRYPIRCIKDSI